MARLKSGRRVDQRESATHSAFSVVLMGLRIAEVGEHAIAHVLGDKPARLADHLRAAVMIGTHDLSHVLGVEPSRECGRTHKVTEHDRELAAFSRSCSLRRLQGGSIRGWPACCINASCRQFVTAFQAEFGTRRVRVAARRTASEKSRTALQAELAAFGNISLAVRTLHGSPRTFSADRDLLRWTAASPQSGIIDRFG